MADEVFRPRSRDAAINLVRDFLGRDGPAGARGRRTPVVVFTGPRGIGKTALFAELKSQLDQRVPYAYINCERPGGGAREMLSVLAYNLNRQSGSYGTLPFPRLITGLVVIAAPVQLDTIDRDDGRRQVRQVLEEHQRTGEKLQGAVSAILRASFEALGGTGIPDIGTAGLDLISAYGAKIVLGGLAASRRGRRFLLGSGQDWYGHQDRGLPLQPLEVLLDLKGMAAAADAPEAGRDAQDDRGGVAELLWAAFLADLRDSFRGQGRAARRTLNCVVLLDNVDAAAGQEFLTELVTARTNLEREDPDPLTVLATSRGGLAERIRGGGVVPLADASYRNYLHRATTPSASWVYPVALPFVTWAETRDLVRALELRGGSGGKGPVISTAIHAFTGGHPFGSGVLLRAMAEHRDSPADLSAILCRPQPGIFAAQDPTVEETMLDRLLDAFPARTAGGAEVVEVVEDFVTCAAVRHKDTALRMAAAARLPMDSGLMVQFPTDDSPVFAAEFWCQQTAGGPFVLQPMLRRLLLRRLRRRADGDPGSWAGTHGWLRDKSMEAGDQVGELYHALALGEVEHVARQLTMLLELKEADKWLRLVADVTAAPNRLDHGVGPRSQVTTLTAWSYQRELPIGPVARLVSCSWIGADPLSAPHWRWLLGEMANELGRIAPCSAGDGLSVLREEAQRYRDTAETAGWSDVEDMWAARAAARWPDNSGK